MKLTIQRTRVLLLHISFWCVYLSFFVYQVSSYQRNRDVDWDRIIIIVGTQVSFSLMISYLNYFYLLPRLLNRREIWGYVIRFVFLFGILITLRLYVERFFLESEGNFEGYLHSTRFIVQIVTSNLFIVIFVSMLRFAEDWFELEAKKKEIENEKLSSELNFLKAQINPHFLFNTLNNLYYLAYTQSPNTTEVIDKLSKMMRYMIYDTNHPLVPLTKEIDYMQNYISLERLRLSDQVPIDFVIKGHVEGVQIAPLILITFLENAFKHGVSVNQSHAWVKIVIELNGKECTYTVENSRIDVASGEGKSGIGLQNVTRRLELSYPKKHKLHIENLPDRYRVQLRLTLD